MSKVICTGVCVGPAHIRKTVDKNVPKSTGMSRVSSCESVCVRVWLIRSSISILEPRVSHLFYAICHIYYSHISDMQYFFIYYIYMLKASYIRNIRPHTLVASGHIHQSHQATYTSSIRPHALVASGHIH